MSGGGAHQFNNLIITTFRRRLLQRRYIYTTPDCKESRPDNGGKKIELLNEYNKIDFFSLKVKEQEFVMELLMCQPDLLVLFE